MYTLQDFMTDLPVEDLKILVVGIGSIGRRHFHFRTGASPGCVRAGK